MKYLRQFGIILAVTCAGEIMKYFIPLPIPGSIYGLILMFVLLLAKVIKVEHVKEYFRQGSVTLGDGTPINSIPDAIKHSIAYASKDRKSTRLNSSHVKRSRMPSSA